MSNPFDSLKKPKKVKEENYDEWEGQFSCATYRCQGYAKIAKYYPNDRLLVWFCQEGHKSTLENVE